MATQQATQNVITLRGSTAIVTEFFGFAVNNILYQRGIYPPESFDAKQKYGLSLQVTQDPGLTVYLNNVLQQMSEWILQGELQKMVLVVTQASTKEVLERWSFDVQTDKSYVEDSSKTSTKEEVVVMKEIQSIMRQITASVSFLPLLDGDCTFDLLVYTNKEASVPKEWEESDARYITNAADVKLRSFTTQVHKVDTLVTYKADSDE